MAAFTELHCQRILARQHDELIILNEHNLRFKKNLLVVNVSTIDTKAITVAGIHFRSDENTNEDVTGSGVGGGGL